MYGRLHQIAYRILRDQSLAEDATQQAVLLMWRDLPQLRDPDRFEAWSYRLLVNACNAEFRRRKRMLPTVGSSTPVEPVAPDDFGHLYDRDQVERGFAELSVDHRAVLVLRYYLDMPLEGIAEALGVPIGTVNSRLHRAIEKMRVALEAATAAAGAPEGAVR
jgi:RNA polymerase sigma-70 factor (ECF subfamily)